jgi:hypothetical protein
LVANVCNGLLFICGRILVFENAWELAFRDSASLEALFSELE